ncbi:3138_t:CDS:2 [Ambispora gerdemannii]|uniref:3138_t:CDS:1 n=1 Tax=Ambispora gerdemannii TaxID=144530 RepID=A0A9N9A790_9GLOM|nr:3138_t:CDS:2 [Ambispora gerdemannii]
MSLTTVNTNLFPDLSFTPSQVQLSKKISRKTEDWTFAKKELSKRKASANARLIYFERQLQRLESTAVVASRREKTSFEHKKKDNKRGECQKAKTSKKTKNTNKKRKRNTDNSDNKDVEEDTSKIKPKDQIPIVTFFNTVDMYARPFREEDHQFLLNKLTEAEDRKTYEIPALGRHWEDSRDEEPYNSDRGYHSDEIVEVEALGLGTISHGPLTNRLFSAFMAETTDFDIAKLGNKADKEVNGHNEKKELFIPLKHEEIGNIDEKLKLELQYVGILEKDEDLNVLKEQPVVATTNTNQNGRDDDEVKNRLIELQEALRKQSQVNVTRISKIIPELSKHMAYNQFNDILDQLDKQMEDSFAVRFNLTKTPKKKKPANTEEPESNLTRRQRYTEKIGRLFNPEEFMLPTESIFDEDEDIPMSNEELMHN